MEYTGKFKTMYSKTFGEEVNILEYTSDDSTPWCECSMCGKPIKHKMYVVQSADTGLEHIYLGGECVKKFK